MLAPDRTGLALTAADARRIYASGKKVIFAGIENGYPIGTDITRVKEFYDRGGRYMSLAHNGNSQLSDSNTGEAQGFLYNNGLSPLGKEVIKEMNKYGMMVDFSHPSKGAMMQMLALSKAPIIGSHSGVRAICNHSRNAGRRTAQGARQEWRRHSDRRLRGLREVRSRTRLARTAETAALNREFGVALPQGGRGGAGRAAAVVAPAGREPRLAVVAPTLLSTRPPDLPGARRADYRAAAAGDRGEVSADRPRAPCRTSSTTSTTR